MKLQLFLLSQLLLLTTYCFSQEVTNKKPTSEVSHTFYATGNLGIATDTQKKTITDALSKAMQSETANTTLLFLGNNASKDGFSKNNAATKQNLDAYLNNLKPFSKNIVFIPGATDWKAGLKGLKSQEKHLEKVLENSNVFLPENGCPLKKVKINDEIDLLILDSQWAISDWDKIPNMNDNCDIKSKVAFYEEVEHEIVKSQGKTVLVALYHPIATYGKYGNSYSFGLNSQNLNNKFYKELSERLLTISQRSENVVFISGHEPNLQYIIEKKTPIIISGAAATFAKAHKGVNSRFHYNELGFSKITAYKDGSLWLSFYGVSNNFETPIYKTEVISAPEEVVLPDYKEYDTPKFVTKSIYKPEELKRSSLHKAFWGEHFRSDYEQGIEVKTALLDTLYGGLSPMRKGGGHQTNSLRLKTKDGREFVMRSAKKSALRFIQYYMFKTNYLDPDLEDMYFIRLLQDYWTTANPYGLMTIGTLSDALDIYHANTALFFVPRQMALGSYNEAYGDKIYFIEERLTDGHDNVASLGNSNKIEGTTDLLKELRRKDKIKINESLYIRTRLFDNIIGDWDRHADQWRWAVQEGENGVDFYEPIPRDRDQAFSDFDGFMLGALTSLNPPLHFMQRYNENYSHTKWFNDAGDDVDFAVLIDHTQEDWLREARFIKEHLTEEIINNAFAKFPAKVDQLKMERTRKALLGRIAKVEENAIDLYEYLRSTVIITGTDKDDWFLITRKPHGITNVSGYRIIKGEKGTKFWDVDYDKSVTKELWIYGLDDEDIFEVEEEGDEYIKIKIIGGQNNDVYRINNNRNLRVFDQKSKPNTFETPVSKTLSDNYDLNTYYFKKNKRDISQIIPLIGFDPDNGLGIGANVNYTKNSLWKNPFTSKHEFGFKYFTATSGFDTKYSGEFANLFNKVNFGIDIGYNSPKYTDNFFGFGNETTNFDDSLDFDFNRVRIQSFSFSPSLVHRGYHGSTLKFAVNYEKIEVENTDARFIGAAGVNPKVFEGQNFFGTEVSYEFTNFDDEVLPVSGLGIKLTTGYKSNFNENRGYTYVIPELRLTTKIDKGGRLVYATKLKGHLNLGDDYEFYQAASMGDSDGLRGFRQQRFSGKRSYYQNSDLRLSLGRIHNSIVPISYGVYAGFDYGRVWVSNDTSSKWHTSYGGGIFLKLAGLTTANFAYFNSEDGGRLNIGFSIPF